MAAEDFFNRQGHARRLVQNISSRDLEKPEVIGIVGAWGSGKSTFMDYMRDEVDKKSEYKNIITLKFNPWWFSSATELINRFFIDLGAVLVENGAEDKKIDAAKKLKSFGRILAAGSSLANLVSYTVPLAKVIADVSKAGGDFLDKAGEAVEENDKSLDSLHKEIIKSLQDLKQPVWIFVDDLDRLQRDELLAMFTLLRSLGELPYIKYIVAVAPEGITAALDNNALSQSYADKILTENYYLPDIPNQYLIRFFEDQLVSRITKLESQQELIQLALSELTRMRLTPRKLERLINSVHHMLVTNDLIGEVFLSDLIIIEALRQENLTVYEGIKANPHLLLDDNVTTLQSRSKEDRLQEFRQQVNISDDDWKNRIMPIIKSLFPSMGSSISSWLFFKGQQQGIRNREYFNIYFTSDPDADGVSHKRRRNYWQRLDNSANEFWDQISGLDEEIPKIITAVCDYHRLLPLTNNANALDQSMNRICTLFQVFGIWSKHSDFKLGDCYSLIASFFNSASNFPKHYRKKVIKNLLNAISDADFRVKIWILDHVLTSGNSLLEEIEGSRELRNEFQNKVFDEVTTLIKRVYRDDSNALNQLKIEHLEALLSVWKRDRKIFSELNQISEAPRRKIAEFALGIYREINNDQYRNRYYEALYWSELFDEMNNIAPPDIAQKLKKQKQFLLKNS